MIKLNVLPGKRCRLLGALMPLLLSITFYGCKKDNEETPAPSVKTASVRVVNAVEGSAPQEFYMDGVKLNTKAVAYGEASDYASGKSGESVGEFRAAGSAMASARVDLNLNAGAFYSLYYVADGDQRTYMRAEDSIAIPVPDKARIRLINLSRAAGDRVDLTTAAGTKIVQSLAFRRASYYQQVDPNVTLLLFLSGSATVGLNMPTSVKAGKTYNIVVSGASAASLKYHVFEQN